jgi:hypothetical protein
MATTITEPRFLLTKEVAAARMRTWTSKPALPAR